MEQMRLHPDSCNDGNLNGSMPEEYLCAKLHLVDLAGSERAKRTGSDGLRFKEGKLRREHLTFFLARCTCFKLLFNLCLYLFRGSH